MVVFSLLSALETLSEDETLCEAENILQAPYFWSADKQSPSSSAVRVEANRWAPVSARTRWLYRRVWTLISWLLFSPLLLHSLLLLLSDACCGAPRPSQSLQQRAGCASQNAIPR